MILDRALYWAPRLLAIAFIAFISLFAFDVFDEQRGLPETLAALAMHLIPSCVLTAALLFAWKWEWIGTAVFGAIGLLYIGWVTTMSRPVPPPMRMVWILTIAGPAFLVAGLFLGSWRAGIRR